MGISVAGFCQSTQRKCALVLSGCDLQYAYTVGMEDVGLFYACLQLGNLELG